jgi:hypothetical protein
MCNSLLNSKIIIILYTIEEYDIINFLNRNSFFVTKNFSSPFKNKYVFSHTNGK